MTAIPRVLLSEERCKGCGCIFARVPQTRLDPKLCGFCIAQLSASRRSRLGTGDGESGVRIWTFVEQVDALREATWAPLLHRAETEQIGLDISDFGDEFCEGFLAGQRSVLEEIAAGRLSLPEHWGFEA